MTFSLLRETIHNILPLEDEDWKVITPHLKLISFEENELLLTSNTTCDFIAFIVSGSCRSFITDSNLNETNLLLRSSFEFITDYESFVQNTPSNLSIQAIEQGEAILLNQKGLYKVYESSFYWNKFGRIMSEFIFINSKRRTEDLLFLNPTERYLKLMKQNPEYFQKYPLKHIAGYLGVTPQSLSRIRKQITMP